MGNAVRKRTIAELRASIQRLDRRGPVTVAADCDGGILDSAPEGLLHEVWTDEYRNGGVALGFALGQARRFVDPRRPVLLWLQAAHDGQETGLPYGPGLAQFGIGPDSVLIVRVGSIIELLWAAEEAVACRAVAAVIAEIGGSPKALDFTASRRLALRAGASGTSVFLMRYGRGREASAAGLRWSVSPAESLAADFDPKAPGQPVFRVRLEKGFSRSGRLEEGAVWTLRWDKQNGFGIVRDRDRRREAGKALYGALSAALGDRLSQTA